MKSCNLRNLQIHGGRRSSLPQQSVQNSVRQCPVCRLPFEGVENPTPRRSEGSLPVRHPLRGDGSRAETNAHG